MIRRIWTMVIGILVLVPLVTACQTAKKEQTVQLAVPAPMPELSGPKKRVGIFEFENKSRYGQRALSQAATDVLYSELEKSGMFVLYERAELEQLEKEWDLVESGRVNLSTAAQVGKLTGVQAVVVGTISEFGIWDEALDYGAYKKKTEIAEATVDVRVVDATNGRIIAAETGTGRTERELETVLGFGEKASFDETMADKALRAAITKFIDQLVRELNQMPWEGRVADVETSAGTELIYVNAGRKSGMPMGELLTVKRVTGKLTDPVTQEFLGYKTVPLGMAEVIDYVGEDVSIARMTSGSGAGRGDMVSLAGR